MYSYLLKHDDNDQPILVKRKCGDELITRRVPSDTLLLLHSREALIHANYLILHFGKQECCELDTIILSLPITKQ